MVKDKKSEIYTSGKSFRAIAEANARSYRLNNLHLSTYDTYGHILTDSDGENGMNFLPSLRTKILKEVYSRNEKGKGVDIGRTTKNMLSSQAMCFNLFVPLNLNKQLATAFLRELSENVAEVCQDIEYEYTPSKTIFNDQSGKGGVDCDALIKFKNCKGGTSLIVVETKFVEPEFSKCGFRKSDHEDQCPLKTLVAPDFSNCRYHYKKHYNYWRVAEESNLFNMEMIQNQPCPFGGTLWQLWTNMSLAYALSKEYSCDDFYYAVIYHEKNDKLSKKGKTFIDFRKLLKNPNKLKIIYLSDIRKAFDEIGNRFPGNDWTNEFVERYCL